MLTLPSTPGLDFAGTISALSLSSSTNPDREDQEWKVGDRVFGCLQNPGKYGSLGEYMVVEKDRCALIPEGVEMDEAAAVGCAAMTAYQSLLPSHVKKGARMFVNGGSGGVGTWGIQFAKCMGAEVITSCSSRNVALCRELGADEVIDYTTENLVERLEAMGEFDILIDNINKDEGLWQNCTRFLKEDGIFVVVGMEVTCKGMGGMLKKKFQPTWMGGVPRAFHFVAVDGKRADFEVVADWMKDGKAKAVVGETVEFEDVPKAFQRLRTGKTRGKIVVHVGEH